MNHLLFRINFFGPVLVNLERKEITKNNWLGISSSVPNKIKSSHIRKRRGCTCTLAQCYYCSLIHYSCRIRLSSLFTPFSVVRPTQIFGNFKKKKKKGNDVVKPFLTRNNSFNLKNEHSNSIEKNRNKNRNIFLQYIVYFINPNMSRASYSKTSC